MPRAQGGGAAHRDPARGRGWALRLRTDPDRLTQVFINLIANARKYCDAAQPELRIAVRRQGGAAVVDFIDNGQRHPGRRRRR